jgi:glyoxylase-like metal-dependent hydrolase (beta-lactamase superfamily II)
MKGTRIAYPALAFTDRMEIDLGDRKIELIYLRPSHTDGSIMVYLPDKKVLFAGDILSTNYHPFIGDGNIEEWIKTLDYIMTMDVEKIIPGHGPLSNKKDIEDMKNYLIAFDKNAKELAAKSNDAEYIASEIKKSLPQRPEGANLILWNIQMKYMKK